MLDGCFPFAGGTLRWGAFFGGFSFFRCHVYIIAHFLDKHKGYSVWHFPALRVIINVLDRRQAVRHWVLVPAFAGSNPAGPAILAKSPYKGIFLASLVIRRTSARENILLMAFS